MTHFPIFCDVLWQESEGGLSPSISSYSLASSSEEAGCFPACRRCDPCIDDSMAASVKGESHGITGAHTTKFSGKKSFCWCRWVKSPVFFRCVVGFGGMMERFILGC